MSHQHDRTRRALLTSLASLTVAKMVLPSSASASAELPLKDRRTLVAYLSRPGGANLSHYPQFDRQSAGSFYHWHPMPDEKNRLLLNAIRSEEPRKP